ncbi:MAG: UDP-glucose 4-epimerase GalE [Oscillospiraceae bacterium]|nr:UDP-glucose 4-epimerase GalE [Oscillospiraceae bacterium]
MKILVTGGAGYIGSHTCVQLLQAGHEVVIVDDLSNSHRAVIHRIESLGGSPVRFYEEDVCDKKALSRIFAVGHFDAVIHFAGYKAVGESVEQPLRYYRNNLDSTLTLLEVMEKFSVHNLIFSSSATVYGESQVMPITEDQPLGETTNPYGTSKKMQEQILMDIAKADPSFNPILLRYFNPVGAHESGEIGEDPNGIPNNLMPYISQVAIGHLEKLRVFGDDYPTPDGTGVRDYIHVVDLAAGHVAALQLFQQNCGLQIYNLGTGRGYSVLEVLHAYEQAVGKELPYEIVGRRAGDIAICYADPEKAARELHWRAERTLEQMCRDAWNWQTKNPNGYKE